jgi:hypothetical protein
LNSLYGKFGELREKEVAKGDDPDQGFYRRPCNVPKELVWETEPKFDWRYDPSDYPEGDTVDGMEWSAWGTFQVTAGQVEGPNSIPPIAAHVTDYARMLLYKAMTTVGLENVLYCDTDSLMIASEHVSRLEGQIDETRLGALKIEGVTESFSISGCKDYRFGDERKRKGIRSSAVETEVDTFSQPAFPGLWSLLRSGSVDGFPIATVTRRSVSGYDKGHVSQNGRVTPWVFPADNRGINGSQELNL